MIIREEKGWKRIIPKGISFQLSRPGFLQVLNGDFSHWSMEKSNINPSDRLLTDSEDANDMDLRIKHSCNLVHLYQI